MLECTVVGSVLECNVVQRVSMLECTVVGSVLEGTVVAIGCVCWNALLWQLGGGGGGGGGEGCTGFYLFFCCGICSHFCFFSISPDKSIRITMTVFVDTESVAALTSEKEKLEDILIFHLEGGKDYFISSLYCQQSLCVRVCVNAYARAC